MVLAVSDRAISGYQMLEMPRYMFKAQWNFRSTAVDRQIFLIQNDSERSSLSEVWGIRKREDLRHRVICVIQMHCSKEQAEKMDPKGKEILGLRSGTSQ